MHSLGDLEYASKSKGVAHVCGHDGHMSILAGLAKHVAENPFEKGKMILLFQPAEETGQGARQLVKEKGFIDQLKPDFVFALHNLPGFSLHSVVLKKETFCWASVGLTARLTGVASHAAEPEKGISPAIAIAKIIEKILHIQAQKHLFSDEIIITIIHAKLGEKAFGTSPGNAEICATLRCANNEDMKLLKSAVLKNLEEICKREKLSLEYDWIEEFLAVENDSESVDIIKNAALNSGLEMQPLEKAFRWSEDFSWFTNSYKGALFGLGSGNNQPNLHNPNFDFPDKIIPSGVKLFRAIYEEINS